MSDPDETQDGSQLAFADTVAGSGPTTKAAPLPIFGSDRYEIVAVLGEGGMGTVYRARDARLGRDVALKFIRGGDPRLTVRLLREARAQAKIDHDNVCKVFDVGEIEGKAYIAMQLVSGQPLGEVAGRMSLHDKVQAIRDAALALHEAHMIGVLHRDIKPSNILVETTEDGRFRPIVMDFGIARNEDEGRSLTETGALLGTPAYMSPEQARGGGRALDRRSDVYSLGATLYELLSGVPPFEGDAALKIVLRVLSEEPLPLRARVRSVPEDLETIVAKCLSKEPGQRYDSARALADDLDRYIRGEPILGRREGLLQRLRRRAGQHRALVATAAVALAWVGIAGGFGIRARVAAQRQAAAHEAEARPSLDLDKNDIENNQVLAELHLLRARNLLRRSEDPNAALAALDRALDACFALAAKDPTCSLLDARGGLLHADVEAARHAPVRATLDSARRLAELAVTRNPDKADAHQVLAEAEQRIAVVATAASEQAKHRAAGLAAVERGLRVDPNHPRLLATKGALLLLDARVATDRAAQADAARAGRDALRRAIELNPLLRSEAGPLLDDAERLAAELATIPPP